MDQDKANAPKITLMVGHDSNIASLLSALQVKPYELPGTWENTPIGGQVVFERWHDAKNNKDLLKLEYVYQTADQLRDGEMLSLKNPPKRVTLQLEGCPTDGNGYCSWEQFTQALNGALQGTPMEPAAQPQPAAATAGNSDADKPADSKPAADKAAADKAAADKAAAEKAAAEKAAAEKAAAQKAAEAKAAEEKAKAAEEKAKAERAAAQKAAAEKVAADKAAADKAGADKPADAPGQKPVESAQNSDAKQTVTQ